MPKRKNTTPQTTLDELALIWDEEKNGIKFQKHLPWNEAFYWEHKGTCGCVHSFVATVTEMMYKSNTPCKICRKKNDGIVNTTVIPCCEETSLKGHPALIQYWDEKQNINVDPRNIFANSGSDQKYYWKCVNNCKDVPECCHKWSNTIFTQRNSKGCPFCNRFGNVYPCCYKTSALANENIMKYWDEVKNSELGIFPENIRSQSEWKIWWLCPKSCTNSETCLHAWTNINARLTSSLCPFCSGSRVCCAKKSAHNFPLLRNSFAYDHPFNVGIDLTKLAQYSPKKCMWRCDKNCGWIKL